RFLWISDDMKNALARVLADAFLPPTLGNGASESKKRGSKKRGWGTIKAEIMRTHTNRFSDFLNNPQKRKALFDAFDEVGAPVSKNSKTGKPRAQTYSELRKGTADYNAVMENLRKDYIRSRKADLP